MSVKKMMQLRADATKSLEDARERFMATAQQKGIRTAISMYGEQAATAEHVCGLYDYGAQFIEQHGEAGVTMFACALDRHLYETVASSLAHEGEFDKECRLAAMVSVIRNLEMFCGVPSQRSRQ